MRKATSIGSSVLVALSIALQLFVVACEHANRTAISQSIDDATLSTHVKTALLNEPSITVTRIDVDTSQGVVTLSGVVKSKEEEQLAIDTARKVSGVRDVKSALKIVP